MADRELLSAQVSARAVFRLPKLTVLDRISVEPPGHYLAKRPWNFSNAREVIANSDLAEIVVPISYRASKRTAAKGFSAGRRPRQMKRLKNPLRSPDRKL